MKNMIMVLCLAAAAAASPAQNRLSFHVQAGIGTSYLRLEKTADSDTHLAYKAGLGVEYVLSRKWVLRSGLEMVSIGGRESIWRIGEANMNEIYLQMPLLAAIRLHLGKDYLVSLNAGGYGAYAVGGKTSVRTTIYGEENPGMDSGFRADTFGKVEDEKMGNVRFDSGIALGLTFEYRRFSLGVEVQGGLVTVNRDVWKVMDLFGRKGYMPKNLASFFILGYRF